MYMNVILTSIFLFHTYFVDEECMKNVLDQWCSILELEIYHSAEFSSSSNQKIPGPGNDGLHEHLNIRAKCVGSELSRVTDIQDQD